jgi:hypothetical protein
VPYVIDHQAGLVLKPAHGYGGRSVLVGDETAPETWAAAVQDGLREPWVVQERVHIRRRCSRCWRTTARSGWRRSR